MSGAFTKEGDAADDFPERPVSELPNYVTPEGLRLLREKVAALLQERAVSSERRTIDRDLRYFETRLDSSILIEHRNPPEDIRFGAIVRLEEAEYRIVGEDEADPAAGKLAWSSPLARALIGKKTGETVELDGRTLLILGLRY